MITFIYNTKSINMPSPRLNDSESLALPVIIHRSKNGTIRAYRKLSLPISHLSLFFEHMNRPKMVELFAFAAIVAGQQLSYIDYNKNKWLGTITNFPLDETHVALRNNQITLEFEGYRA